MLANFLYFKVVSNIYIENYKRKIYMEKKRLIRLTENDIRNLVKESVKIMLKEQDIDNDSYYGGGLPDSAYQDPGNESPNEMEDFEGNPAWEAIDAVMERNGIRDIDFNEYHQMVKPIAPILQKIDNSMQEAIREVYSNGDGKTVTVNQDDVIKYVKETLPNVNKLLYKIKALWIFYGWLTEKR